MTTIARINTIQRKVERYHEAENQASKGIPIVKCSEAVMEEYQKKGLPVPIMGGLSNNTLMLPREMIEKYGIKTNDDTN
jgi:hypothetical protein